MVSTTYLFVRWVLNQILTHLFLFSDLLYKIDVHRKVVTIPTCKCTICETSVWVSFVFSTEIGQIGFIENTCFVKSVGEVVLFG